MPIFQTVEHTVWTFSRGEELLRISRQPVEDGTMLVVAGDGAPRSYFFRDLTRLEIFQRDMETLLLKTGWTFRVYSPERRGRRDRRGWPRAANDRRRWWTDGQEGREQAQKDLDADAEAVKQGGPAPDAPQRRNQ